MLHSFNSIKKRDREAFFEHEREGKEARRLAAEAENMTEEDRAEQVLRGGGDLSSLKSLLYCAV